MNNKIDDRITGEERPRIPQGYGGLRNNNPQNPQNKQQSIQKKPINKNVKNPQDKIKPQNPPKKTKPKNTVGSSMVVANRERLAKFDMPFFIILLVLLVFGAIMLLSASSPHAAREMGDNYYYFNRQLGFIIVGMVLMIGVSFIPYQIFLNKKIVILMVVVTVSLMLFVFFNGINYGGAERWIRIFGVDVQPSEILKFVLVVVLANIVHKYPDFLEMSSANLDKFPRALKLILRPFKAVGFTGFFIFAVIIGISCLLTIVQPHLSGAIIILAIGAMMMIASPIRLRYIIVAAVGAIVVGAVVLTVMKALGYEYIETRLLSWQNPEADIQDGTFQTYQSLVTIGSGGWFGLGLGNSRQKFSYLPAAHNDFIFSVICEELGFVGGVLVLMLFIVFILRGYYIAAHARDRFGMMLAVGMTTQVGLQAFLNIAVATNSVPNTGILLPFFSYGGTAMMMLLPQMGILLNISRKARIE